MLHPPLDLRLKPEESNHIEIYLPVAVPCLGGASVGPSSEICNTHLRFRSRNEGPQEGCGGESEVEREIEGGDGCFRGERWGGGG